MRVLGYTKSDWDDMYRVYKYWSNPEKIDVYAVKTFWEGLRPKEPDNCIEIASIIIKARSDYKDLSEWNDMFEYFVREVCR